MDQRLGTDVLWDKVGVLAHPVAGTFDLDHHSVVEQAVEQRGGDHGTAEHFKLPLTSNGLFLPLPLRTRVTRCMASG